MSSAVNIICLNWGNRYPERYVNNLYRSVKKYLHRPFRFVCVTDKTTGFDEGVEYVPIPENPGVPRWPHVFLKLLITADGFADLKGPTLFFDVDIIRIQVIKIMEPMKTSMIAQQARFLDDVHKECESARSEQAGLQSLKPEINKLRYDIDALAESNGALWKKQRD